MSTTATTRFVRQDDLKGRRVTQVAKMIEALKESDTPVSFDDLCEQAEAKYPQDVQAGMIALELIGQVDRYTFVDSGSTRTRVAYAWGADAVDPTQADA